MLLRLKRAAFRRATLPSRSDIRTELRNQTIPYLPSTASHQNDTFPPNRRLQNSRASRSTEACSFQKINEPPGVGCYELVIIRRTVSDRKTAVVFANHLSVEHCCGSREPRSGARLSRVAATFGLSCAIKLPHTFRQPLVFSCRRQPLVVGLAVYRKSFDVQLSESNGGALLLWVI